MLLGRLFQRQGAETAHEHAQEHALNEQRLHMNMNMNMNMNKNMLLKFVHFQPRVLLKSVVTKEV